MNELTGKKVLITGAGKGIGRGIALAFARTGAKLFLHYRSNPEEAQSLLDEIKGLGTDAVAYRADLSKMGELEALAARVADWGSVQPHFDFESDFHAAFSSRRSYWT